MFSFLPPVIWPKKQDPFKYVTMFSLVLKDLGFLDPSDFFFNLRVSPVSG